MTIQLSNNADAEQKSELTFQPDSNVLRSGQTLEQYHELGRRWSDPIGGSRLDFCSWVEVIQVL